MITGELAERDIQLDVLEAPTWKIRPEHSTGVEEEKVNFQLERLTIDSCFQRQVEMRCQAYGVPEPHYTWVDWEGIDATEKETWVLDETSGTLTAFTLERQDAGVYTCIAENIAGRIEASARLDVIIKPHVQELYNKTIGIGAENVTLTCKASGDPLPKVVWRKWSRNEVYIEGTQPYDPRITVVESEIEAPDYTDGERVWVQSVLNIQQVNR